MSSEADKQLSLRRRALSGLYSSTVIDWILHNRIYSTEEKQEIVSIASSLIRKLKLGRVYWEQLQYAIRIWNEEKGDDARLRRRKEAEKEVESYGF